MSRGTHEVCTCGHRYPEHSLFGTCYGCLDCPDVEERPPGDQDFFDDHPYRRCGCAAFDGADDIEGADQPGEVGPFSRPDSG